MIDIALYGYCLLVLAATVNALGCANMAYAHNSNATEWIGRLESPDRGGCTIALVRPQWVLTASHCVTKEDLVCADEDCISRDAYHGKVYIGGVNPMYSGDDGDVREIDYIAIPEGQLGGSLEKSDLALLHLTEPVYLKSYPNIVDVHYGGPFSMKGFGRNEDNEFPNLQVGHGIEQTDCDDEGYICYDMSNQEAQAAHGDSGGPAYYEEDGEEYIFGIVHGRIRHLGVNTDLAFHSAWIQQLLDGGTHTCDWHCQVDDYCPWMDISPKCDTNRYTSCATSCVCETEETEDEHDDYPRVDSIWYTNIVDQYRDPEENAHPGYQRLVCVQIAEDEWYAVRTNRVGRSCIAHVDSSACKIYHSVRSCRTAQFDPEKQMTFYNGPYFDVPDDGAMCLYVDANSASQYRSSYVPAFYDQYARRTSCLVGSDDKCLSYQEEIDCSNAVIEYPELAESKECTRADQNIETSWCYQVGHYLGYYMRIHGLDD